MQWLGLIKVVFELIQLWIEKSREARLLAAGKAEAAVEAQEKQNELVSKIKKKQRALSDADIDRMLKPPSARATTNVSTVSDTSPSLPHKYEQPDER